ncbi:YtxH domain-containing protein [Thermoflexus sp.]|uniref:YtxH domain-containing protein n=1 Tax=Thermoflexus sp. TaxID=1969742 RepID=UPI0025DDF07A|nr:YtxH domain-containing protein [Thermoflexus sp.]MDW8181008.1 YtxH domain-containing protein [Anaerolineae bacterium]MCS6963627.1 YtxH domain-containing protein [Thermoflexus sp.]MCS7351550.1 YtxH domain-containing protein [Thermoflexus sp.]MCX7691333.1 YtxH domain-containing protein [Thermoflexus sp.]MDW8184764.1 YtxH domain-containing protein [Anaerolineae bacterium]
MRRAIFWIYGFLIGGLTGAGLILLFTPQSGAELRETIRARWQQILEEGRQAAAQHRAELERELAMLTRRTPPGPPM